MIPWLFWKILQAKNVLLSKKCLQNNKNELCNVIDVWWRT